jgi:DNA-binding beta-propeller fold protein YncE
LSFTTLAGTAYAFDRKWGSQGTGNGQFRTPVGIAVDYSNNVYVADSGNHRVQKFSSTGAFITKWGTYGTGDGQFNSPTGVGVGILGNVYVTDADLASAYNHRVQWFSSTGGFLGKWGTYGTGDGQFNGPWRVAVDELGYVYVTDWYNNRIQRFKPTQ